MFKKIAILAITVPVMFSCYSKENEGSVQIKTVIANSVFNAKIPYKDKFIDGDLVETLNGEEIIKKYKKGFLLEDYSDSLEKEAMKRVKEYESKNSFLGKPLYFFYSDAKIATVYQHKDGKLVDKAISFNEDGSIAFVVPFKDGKTNGDFIHYEDNKKNRVTIFKDNVAIETCGYENDIKKDCHKLN